MGASRERCQVESFGRAAGVTRRPQTIAFRRVDAELMLPASEARDRVDRRRRCSALGCALPCHLGAVIGPVVSWGHYDTCPSGTPSFCRWSAGYAERVSACFSGRRSCPSCWRRRELRPRRSGWSQRIAALLSSPGTRARTPNLESVGGRALTDCDESFMLGRVRVDERRSRRRVGALKLVDLLWPVTEWSALTPAHDPFTRAPPSVPA
jgi:hypothetical protein